ncbi:hypothetical protein GNZ01_05645 [Escherichia coli]|uniref:Uncharacterized protein n=2 Tax=root TaxID=1 RepID=A0AAJ2Y3D0_ECOLX|nr:hypothetical protein [Escherichia coli]YP_009101704.1 hypothetical protein PBI_121Q_110 [Escherichia phage 121Q]AIT14007.1 hypothetical protein PBI_121Q_110 [Escherichia phage 121Q]MUM71370.1 hypothetical protein [Escherichia coli]MUM82729.1 hypothetical protein [Escherichia coli]HAN4490858.1 hypothetical protein [Escherichia coli]
MTESELHEMIDFIYEMVQDKNNINTITTGPRQIGNQMTYSLSLWLHPNFKVDCLYFRPDIDAYYFVNHDALMKPNKRTVDDTFVTHPFYLADSEEDEFQKNTTLNLGEICIPHELKDKMNHITEVMKTCL